MKRYRKWLATSAAALIATTGLVVGTAQVSSAHVPSTSVTANGQYHNKPDKPAPVVKYGEWSSDNLDCQNMVVTHTRKVYTFDWFWLFNQWVMNPIPNITTQTETVREATNKECGIIPTQPNPQVEKSEWVDEPWECGVTTTTQTRTITTTPYVWNADKWDWVLDEANSTTTTKTRTRDLTRDEWKTCPKPDKIVVTGHQDDAPVCEPDHSWWIVVQHWTQTTTDWVLDDNNQWVKGEPVVKKWSSRQQVDNDGKPCPAETQTPTPTETQTPTPTDTGTQTPTPSTTTTTTAPVVTTTQTPDIGTAISASRNLPRTGGFDWSALAAGLVLITFGTGAVLVTRRSGKH